MIIEEFFASESIPAVVKWVVTILFTGFVAQFGKKLADFIILRLKHRKENGSVRLNGKGGQITDEKAADKSISEKIAKSEQKRLKKLTKETAKLQKKKAKKN